MTMELYKILKEQRERIETLKSDILFFSALSHPARAKILDILEKETEKITEKINNLQW